jgi:hypothetical protein
MRRRGAARALRDYASGIRGGTDRGRPEGGDSVLRTIGKLVEARLARDVDRDVAREQRVDVDVRGGQAAGHRDLARAPDAFAQQRATVAATKRASSRTGAAIERDLAFGGRTRRAYCLRVEPARGERENRVPDSDRRREHERRAAFELGVAARAREAARRLIGIAGQGDAPPAPSPKSRAQKREFAPP